VYQEVLEGSDFEVSYIEGKETIGAYIESFVRPFDLNKEYPFRVGIVRDIEGGHLLLIDMHHIISDGVSHSILLEEFARLYEGEALPEVSLHYKDYAEWQQSEVHKEQQAKDKEYWEKMYVNKVTPLTLSYDYMRPRVKNDLGSSTGITLTAELTKKIRNLLESKDVTMFMFLLSIHKIVLSKLSGQEDIVIGTPTSGRSHADVEQMVGMFVNTLALRSAPSGEKRYVDYLSEVKELVLSSFEHEEYQYEDLIESLSLSRDASRNPLFDVMFTYQYEEEVGDKVEKGTIESYQSGKNTVSKFDLEFNASDNGKEIALSVTYCTALFKESTIQNYIKYVENCIHQVLNSAEKKLINLEVITQEDKEKLVNNVGKGIVNTYYKESSFLELFKKQVKLNPDSIAIAYEEKELSYKELDYRSTEVALMLQEQGIRPHDFVGLYVERNISIPIGILGILKMGGVYVPIDIEYPEERVNFIISDSQIKCLIANDSKKLEALSLEKTKVLSIATDKQHSLLKIKNVNVPNIVNEDLAYMIYTSGTTGRPKGVMTSHRALSDYVHTVIGYFGLKPTDSILQQSSISFDTSIEEIFPILGVGGKLVITEERRDFEKVVLDCLKHKITVLSTNPYLLEYVNEHIEDYELSLRILISGGDTLKWSQVNNLISKFSVYNTYGPTETTVCATYYKVEKQLERLPIGKPIWNREVYILDANLKLQPEGVVGELYIGGAGIAEGYLNRSELTAEHFVVNPFKEKKKMYRTGDLGKWLPDGNIEFLGRKDTQVKIRGYRIELEEIENKLLEIEGVRQAKVIVVDHKETKQLVAYVVSENLNKETIRTALANHLPDYMIPVGYHFIEKILLTENGKVAIEALPAPKIEGDKSEYIAPRNKTERKLATIWEALLHCDKVSIKDNFFELGGHSLLLIKLKVAIKKELGLQELELQMLFKYPTIEEFSKAVSQFVLSAKQKNSRLKQLSLGGEWSPIYIIPGLYGMVDYYYDLAQMLGENRAVYGIEAYGMQGEELPLSSVEEMARKNIEEIRKVQPKGPYAIVGHSDGGIIALEMKRQLDAEKELVILTMLDSQLGIQPVKEEQIGEHVSFLLERYLREEFFTPKEGCKREHIEKEFFEMKNNISKKGISSVVFNFLETYFEIDDYMETFKKLFKVCLTNLTLDYEIVNDNYEALLIQAESHNYEFKDENVKRWKSKNSRMIFETSSGDHFTMVQKENVEELSKKILTFMTTEIIIE
ncbi:amino acid adenylation domain-containing protein, partial [Tenacibaculum sp. FZY0031]|uniref:non-ribosomal peptide synthetase n=1 Tax=Tenacibaculum sp. FZY0031 TaxID=3116648 RepID=UPI002EBF46AC|nr:amino acid adenylation domain-containing protein [Tenacibaculum sp. FZY0031]